MNKFLLVLVFLLSFNAFTQTKAVTTEGDTIIINANGTWEKLRSSIPDADISDFQIEFETSVDEFTGNKKLITEPWRTFGKSEKSKSISGFYVKMKDISGFQITYYGDLGCFSKNSTKMLVKLTSGDVIEMTFISDVDCNSSHHSGLFVPVNKDDLNNPDYESIMYENIALLKKYDWESIRIYGSKYYSDLKPNSTRKVEFPEQFFRQNLIVADQNF
tara:strand:+ start:121 stop:771 length:651 start_codon:yes stop_codon:yes gene_type:complete